MVSSASDCTTARSTTHSSRSPGASSGSTITAKCWTPSRSPSRTRSPSGASCGETQASRPLDRADPGAGDHEHPRRRVGPALVQPGLVGAQQPVPVVRVLGQGDVREHPAYLGHAGDPSPQHRLLGSGPMSTHIGADPGQIAPTVLLPGDPLRAKWIAETFLDDATCYSEVRGMFGFTGTWQGTPVSVQGSGMGQPSMSIYVNELFKDYDVQRIIRVGSCGAVTETAGPARRRDRVRRLHRLLDEPAALPRARLRAGGRLRPAARRRRCRRGARRRHQPRRADLLRRHVLLPARRS